VLRRSAPLWLAVAAVAAFLLFFYRLDGVGLIGPDEPRYAAIGREMAASGDWITPRLWGEPWFEKPPLLYWMTAAGFSAGLGDDLAPRLPVALLASAFLGFFFWALRREFGARAAAFSTAILGTSAGYLAYTRVAVTDLPLAATFTGAVLLLLPWISRGERRWLPVAGALLGAAALAKGLVPLVLIAPLAWFARRRWREAWPAILAFAAVAGPWYALVTARNGSAFIEEFFIRHHFGRFASGALQHGQPFWFYAPVFLALLFPWTPLAAVIWRTGNDPRRRALLSVVVFGLVFFSMSRNKLPGYLLPLMPATAALAGVAIAEAKRPRYLLAACAVLLGAVPVVASILPEAIERGITSARLGSAGWPWAAPALIASAVIAARGRRDISIAAIAMGMAAGAAWTAARSFPALDGTVSARAFWREAEPLSPRLCVETAHRSWRYNLNYYSVRPLPDCEAAGRTLRIEQAPGRPAIVRD
jgi:4-amino-4-deoxy-L-arabinose transferase-like glycosyltransferase